jgi:hypothetical protein
MTMSLTEDATDLARAMIASGRTFEWTLIVLSAYFGRETALVALEAIEELHDPNVE